MTTMAELESPSHMGAAEQLQRRAWGMPDAEVVPAHVLVAARHAGGLVAGAFDGESLVGLVFGFPFWRGGQPGLHSHMLAVLPAHRGRGLGERLKWFQRDWCLEQGLPLVRWTFDPLQAANTHLNLNKLGATCSEYLEDCYGPLEGPLNEGIPSDRLVAEWRLLSARVADARAGRVGAPSDPGPLVTPLEGGRPVGVTDVEEGTSVVRVAVPPSVTDLLADDPAVAALWRTVTREALLRYLGRGYRAEAFTREPVPAIVLRRP